MEIRRVIIQITPSQCEAGFFTFDGHTLRQVTEDGKPVLLDGLAVERIVTENDDPELAARTLLRENYSPFNRALNYGGNGWR